jgi:hypothetical protein
MSKLARPFCFGVFGFAILAFVAWASQYVQAHHYRRPHIFMDAGLAGFHLPVSCFARIYGLTASVDGSLSGADFQTFLFGISDISILYSLLHHCLCGRCCGCPDLRSSSNTMNKQANHALLVLRSIIAEVDSKPGLNAAVAINTPPARPAVASGEGGWPPWLRLGGSAIARTT